MGSRGGDSTSGIGIEQATIVVDMAWNAVPGGHRSLLEAIGADQRQVVEGPLGVEVSSLRASVGLTPLGAGKHRELDQAFGVWLPDLRVVLVRLDHPAYADLDQATLERFLARVAWHEWGHALSLDRATRADVDEGSLLLGLAPPGIAATIRGAGYRRRDFTHELVAEIYALLMARRQRGETEKPQWLADEIWEIVRRVTGWTE